eukprot:CAMPEP_0174349092 /NCGR_PEP_ID=MMETSP0811_2-20130205/5760_1 /TAXON_ID=73025 ORGANISM="Eutreptiella gymnastica-like, Strain CCMP1594" /NCGR_SAMPLE_ID=MMETSP0811_2 /ASSEMBLY_ACC=CAM_ASM_000667 /LENGTH=57 /DNA_ID=CAMNT_0015476217 /DNA_START=30 /DNA_END=199 /DNA_ORIENTATION=-
MCVRRAGAWVACMCACATGRAHGRAGAACEHAWTRECVGARAGAGRAHPSREVLEGG